MQVQMNDGLIPLDERLTTYGFRPEVSRLINRLVDKGLLNDEDIWYVTDEFWKLRKDPVDDTP
jgi:hypothetical protein